MSQGFGLGYGVPPGTPAPASCIGSFQHVESPRFPIYATPASTLFVFREERMIGSRRAYGRQTAHGDEKAEDW